MKIEELLERLSTAELVKDGKLKKIELYASTDLANRLAKFIEEVGNYTATGASRTLGFIDDSEVKIKLFIFLHLQRFICSLVSLLL